MNINVSQGNAVQSLSCGGIFCNQSAANLIVSVSVKAS